MRLNCLPMRCPARVAPPAVAIRPPAVGALRPDALRSAPRMSQGRCRADRLTSAGRNALILQTSQRQVPVCLQQAAKAS